MVDDRILAMWLFYLLDDRIQLKLSTDLGFSLKYWNTNPQNIKLENFGELRVTALQKELKKAGFDYSVDQLSTVYSRTDVEKLLEHDLQGS